MAWGREGGPEVARFMTVLAGQYQGTTALSDGLRRTNEYLTDASVTLRQHLLKDFG